MTDWDAVRKWLWTARQPEPFQPIFTEFYPEPLDAVIALIAISIIAATTYFHL